MALHISRRTFTTKFYEAYFTAKLPVIYGHNGHAGGVSPRRGIPSGTWNLRFIEWAKDLYITPATKAKPPPAPWQSSLILRTIQPNVKVGSPQSHKT